MTRRREKLQGKHMDVNEPQNVLQIAQGSHQLSPLPLFYSPQSQGNQSTRQLPIQEKRNPFPKLVSKLQLFKTCHIILNLCSPSDGAALGEAYINVSASSCEIVFLLTGHRREPERLSSEQRRGQLPNIIRTPVERKETLSWQTCLTD